MNEHVNMANFIAPKSDQINADDLIGGPRTITITRVTGNEGNAEQPVNVFFEGAADKPFRPCKSMRRVMVKIWGSDASKYVGKSMTIYRDPKVKWGGMEVGGIRISHMTGLEKPEVMALTETRSARKPYTVQPLKDVAAGGNDAAGKWANNYLAKVKTFANLPALNAFADEKAGRLAELEAALPNAHRQCVEALDEMRRKLAPSDGTLAEDNPSAGEGRADVEHGDQFADDDFADGND